jgi:hypothetical protein
MRIFLLASLSLTLLGANANAGAITVFGDLADSQVYSGGILSGDPGSIGGESGVNGGFDYSMVYVFQLPGLAFGQTVSTADFSFYDEASGSIYNTDLYGLTFRAASTVLASDWYTGTGDPNNTLIESAIVPPSFTFAGRLTTSTAADATLASYLNAQYTAGAVGGDFVFLRLSTDATNPQNNNVNFYYTADYPPFLASGLPGSLPIFEARFSPMLDLTLTDPAAVPEPTTAAGVMCGLLLLAAARRYSTR